MPLSTHVRREEVRLPRPMTSEPGSPSFRMWPPRAAQDEVAIRVRRAGETTLTVDSPRHIEEAERRGHDGEARRPAGCDQPVTFGRAFVASLE
jgi:hypothetical protein